MLNLTISQSRLTQMALLTLAKDSLGAPIISHFLTWHNVVSAYGVCYTDKWQPIQRRFSYGQSYRNVEV